MEFAAAIAATLLACLAIRWGTSLHQGELATGKAPGFFWFWVFCVGGSGALILLRDTHPFMNALFYDTFGVFIGLALVNFASGFALRGAPPPDPQPKHSETPTGLVD